MRPSRVRSSAAAAASASDGDSSPARISRLSASAADQLRSSVVLCQPSSALHELVCNSLDAGAGRVDVVVDCALMRFTVSDDGRGMGAGEIDQIGLRHHSSKCASLDELTAASSARTAGWRGEAIASITQLACVDMESRARTTAASAAADAQPQKKRRGDSVAEVASMAFGGFEAASAAAADITAAPAAAAAAATNSSSASATYRAVFRHGARLFCGVAPSSRASFGTTVSVCELYENMPVRQKRMLEDRTKERERIKKRLLRLALIHPDVEIALYDATLAQSEQTAVSYFPASPPPAKPAPALASHHLPIRLGQRVWFKPRAASLLANFATSLFSAENPQLIESMVELPAFSPSVPALTTPASTELLRSLRVSGLMTHPAQLHLLHRESQFVYVNRHYVSHKKLNQLVEGMYERCAGLVSRSPDTAEADDVAVKSRTRATGGNALQRGSVKQKASNIGASPAKQGRRRFPAFVLHLELSAHLYDLLFDPDKTSIEFSNAWAVNDGVTQALKSWLFALYPALRESEDAIFPPTYMPQWLQAREDDSDALAPPPPPGSWAAAMSSPGTSVLHGLAAKHGSPHTPRTAPASAQRSPAAPLHRAPASATVSASPAAAAAASSHEPQMQPSRLQFAPRPTAVAAASATVATPSPRRRAALHNCHSHDTPSQGHMRASTGFLSPTPPPHSHGSAPNAQPATESYRIRISEPTKQHAAATPAPVAPSASSALLAPPPSPPSRSPSPSPPISSSWLPQHATVGAASASTSLQFQAVQLSREQLQHFQLVGQLDQKFIVVRIGELLLAVDQHAADERRRLEYLQNHLSHYVESLPLVQSLLLPLSSAESAVLRSHEVELQSWHFRYQLHADGARISLHAVPLICGVELDSDDLREYLQQLHGTTPLKRSEDARRRTPTPVQRILNYKACRSAVMFGDTLDARTMSNILTGLMRCDFPYNCAHGRPTMTPLVQVKTMAKPDDEE